MVFGKGPLLCSNYLGSESTSTTFISLWGFWMDRLTSAQIQLFWYIMVRLCRHRDTASTVSDKYWQNKSPGFIKFVFFFFPLLFLDFPYHSISEWRASFESCTVFFSWPQLGFTFKNGLKYSSLFSYGITFGQFVTGFQTIISRLCSTYRSALDGWNVLAIIPQSLLIEFNLAQTAARQKGNWTIGYTYEMRKRVDKLMFHDWDSMNSKCVCNLSQWMELHPIQIRAVFGSLAKVFFCMSNLSHSIKMTP